MNYTRAEQETTIVWDEEEKVAHIYTASPITMRKLDKLCSEFPETYRRTWVEQEGARITAARYEVANKFVRFRKPPSEAKRSAARMAAKNSPFWIANN